MPVSLHAVIAHIKDNLPHEIAQTGLLKAVNRIGTMFGTSSSSLYLEWHCATPERTDLLCSLRYDRREHFSRRIAQGTGSAHCRPVARFIDAWPKIQAQTKNRIGHLWLAFDYNGTMHTFDEPNIHCCIDPFFIDRNGSPDYRNRMSVRAFTATVDALVSNGLPAITETMRLPIIRCFKTLSKLDGEVLHLSCMHSRTPAITKLNMTVPHKNLPALLHGIGWSGNIGAVSAFCGKLIENDLRLKGNLCMVDGAAGRFELELEYNTPLHSNVRRKSVLSLLAQRKLIGKKQQRSLLAWPGRSDMMFMRRTYTIERWLDIKICFEVTGYITVKPYLGCAPLPKIGWNRVSP